MKAILMLAKQAAILLDTGDILRARELFCQVVRDIDAEEARVILQRRKRAK